MTQTILQRRATRRQRQRRYADAPGLDNHSRNSRTGRKMRRKIQDAHCVAERKRLGLPALAGPPIPNSEKNGRREYHTLQQVRYGNQRSQEVRQAKAAPKHREVIRLRKRGHTLAIIGEMVGYTAARCCQIVKEYAAHLKRKALQNAARRLNLHINHQTQPDDPMPDPVDPAASRHLALMLVNTHHLLKLIEADPGPIDKARYEQLAQGYKHRFKSYLSAVYAAQGPEHPVLEESWALAESVSGMPIDAATRAINADFGYQG